VADLHIGPETATVVERAAVDGVVSATMGPAVVRETERLVRGGTERRNQRRHLLLPVLHALQNQAGWISPGGLNYACEQLQVPPAEAYGVATFYEMFRVDDPGHDGDVVHVCVDAACQIADAEAVIAALETGGGHVHRSPCLGQCERPVARFVQGRAKPDSVPADELVAPSAAVPQATDPAHAMSLRLLRRVGRVDPARLDSYIGAGGYKALTEAFRRGPAGVVAEVETAGLMGRGGAAFPTGFKWKSVAEAAGDQKYVVVNADESEPGTFKDRVLIENDPFAVIEAATIAGFATGADTGYIYIRGEYPLATSRLQAAIAQAREAGFLGDRIARSSFAFDLEVRRGAGAYICGEETALFNSLEGFRGEPRQKPPFPTTNGLFDRPTAINNPETLVNVLDIVIDGGAAYAALGTEKSAGTKLFCLSGHVNRPGVYEVEFGTTLGRLIDIAGGVDGELAAIMLGGAAGSFVGPDMLDLPLSFEAARQAGVSLGSGVVMAFNTGVEFGPVLTRLAEFFRNESCGQCVPCRVGTVRQHEVLVACNGQPTDDHVALLEEMDLAMKDASICGLGHTAATAVRSGISLGLTGGQS
jgi:NADH-quinone oxidoreductase subunit F